MDETVRLGYLLRKIPALFRLIPVANLPGLRLRSAVKVMFPPLIRLAM
jgi:hypothetical protein